MFTGDSLKLDLNDFIFAVETQIAVLKNNFVQLSDEQIIYGIMSRLEGTPYNVYKNYLKKCQNTNAAPSWKGFKEILSKIYDQPFAATKTDVGNDPPYE